MWWKRRTHESPPTLRERRDEAISAYLDDELTDPERTEIEALLADDLDARAALDEFRALRTAFTSLGEVRAPRSFAIPAPVAAQPGGLFRRMELAIRASAAAAALLFIVAVVNQPTSLTVGSVALDSAESATSMQAGELRTAQDGAAGAASAATEGAPDADLAREDEVQPLVAPNETPAADLPPNAGGGVDQPSPQPAEGSPEEEAAKAADDVTEPAAFNPPISGTSNGFEASEGMGGVAPALATLAALLTALSVIVARGRRIRVAGDR